MPDEDTYPVKVAMTLNVVAGSAEDAPRFIASEFANNGPHDLSSRIFNVRAVDLELFPTELFLVMGSGGYDAPDYVARRTLREAAVVAHEWFADDGTDQVDVLRLDLTTLLLERIEADQLP